MMRLSFLSRVSMPKQAERDIVKANPSVRLSVRHTPVLYRNKYSLHRLKLFQPWARFFSALLPLPNFKGNSLSGGVKYMGWEYVRFSTEIAVYFGNCMYELTVEH